MEITFNDTKMTVDAGTSIAELLESEGIHGRYVAVAVDQTIVKSSEWATRVVQAGEHIIVIGAIKGG